MIFEICLVILISYLISLFLEPKTNLPPGPGRIPFLGSLPYYAINNFEEAKKKYGNIIMTRIGAVYCLFICDYKVLKEAYSKPEFADRPDFEGNEKGVLFSSGIHWARSRGFLLRHLHNLGLGRSKMEQLIMGEAKNLVKDFKNLTKEPSELPISINIAVLNVLWQIVASHRYDNIRDKYVEGFMKDFIVTHGKFNVLKIQHIFPILNYVLPGPILSYLNGSNEMYKNQKKCEAYVQPFIDDHLKTLDSNNPRDFIDEYLIEMGKEKSEEFSFTSMKDLVRTTLDLFVAGVFTAATMIRWFIIYMAKFQDIQEKIQHEIDRVVPRDTLPGLQHKNELALLEASISEVHRHSTMTQTVMRFTSKDVKLNGYDIPKGTIVNSKMSVINFESTYFKEPSKFDPSRFLDESGKFIPAREGYLPFGTGKRQCPGENFARMELFLITASLLQTYTFGPKDEDTEISFKSKRFDLIRTPIDGQKFSIKYRK